MFACLCASVARRPLCSSGAVLPLVRSSEQTFSSASFIAGEGEDPETDLESRSGFKATDRSVDRLEGRKEGRREKGRTEGKKEGRDVLSGPTIVRTN